MFNDKIIDKSERLLFGVVNDEFINIYSPDNKQKLSGEVVYFLFTNVLDTHAPMIGQGTIIHDKYTTDMMKIYGIELDCIIEEADVVYRYFNDKKFDLLCGTNIDSRTATIKMRAEFLDKKNSDILSKKLFKINSFFVRDSIADIHELRQKYCSVIFNDIEQQYLEIKKIIDNGNVINPHRFII